MYSNKFIYIGSTFPQTVANFMATLNGHINTVEQNVPYTFISYVVWWYWFFISVSIFVTINFTFIHDSKIENQHIMIQHTVTLGTESNDCVFHGNKY